MFSFVVPGIAPTKGLPTAQRLRLLIEGAERRYCRRRAVMEWFWNWADKKWDKQPALSTKVNYSLVRAVPGFAHCRPRITRVPWRDGKEVRILSQHICYEDCVHLADQAYALLARLERAAAT